MSDFDYRLIELVRANPSLYEREVRSSPYDSSKKKRELWCSIATSLKTDVSTCMTRWNYMREKLRRELQKEQSDWSLLDKLRFVVGQHKKQHKHSQRSVERQLQPQSPPEVTTSGPMNTTWRAQSPEQQQQQQHLIVNDEDDALQEAMDEQNVPLPAATTTINATANATGTGTSSEDLMKRIEALLQGLGANRCKAEKKILAYLCKCSLRALNDEQIDDVFI